MAIHDLRHRETSEEDDAKDPESDQPVFSLEPRKEIRAIGHDSTVATERFFRERAEKGSATGLDAYHRVMADRIMYVQQKTGYDTDQGPAFITRVRFSKTWRTAYVRGRTLHRVTGTAYANHDANFYDVETGDRYWVSGPKRDRTDARYSSQQPEVDADVRAAYEDFLAGKPLPGREHG